MTITNLESFMAHHVVMHKSRKEVFFKSLRAAENYIGKAQASPTVYRSPLINMQDMVVTTRVYYDRNADENYTIAEKPVISFSVGDKKYIIDLSCSRQLDEDDFHDL